MLILSGEHFPWQQAGSNGTEVNHCMSGDGSNQHVELVIHSVSIFKSTKHTGVLQWAIGAQAHTKTGINTKGH